MHIHSFDGVFIKTLFVLIFAKLLIRNATDIVKQFSINHLKSNMQIGIKASGSLYMPIWYIFLCIHKIYGFWWFYMPLPEDIPENNKTRESENAWKDKQSGTYMSVNKKLEALRSLHCSPDRNGNWIIQYLCKRDIILKKDRPN